MCTCFRSRSLGLLLCVTVLAIWNGPSLLRSDEAQPQASDGPQYNEQGELKLPADFRTWVFVGANLGIDYRDDAAKDKKSDKPHDEAPKVGDFHNVYINPSAYAAYAKTGVFPDGTQFVLDIYKAEAGKPGSIITAGHFPGKQTGVALAVKNSARPDGSKTEWAYYDFGLTKKTARAFADKACYDCHAAHADEDKVWVQFYPTLRELRDERAKVKKP